MKPMCFIDKIIYGVLLLVLLSAINTMSLHAQGSFLDSRRLEMLAEQGGYITNTTLPQYMIYGSEKNSELLEESDSVFLNIGTDQGIKPGEQLRIFRVEKLVIHPVTKENLGNLIKVVGKLRVTGVKDKTSTAIITDIYDNPILKGDHVMSLFTGYTGAEKVLLSRKRERRVTGYIVAIKDDKLFASQGDTVYIDQGKINTISVGDIFNIVHFERSISGIEKQIGQLRIISVQEETSTAIINQSATGVSVGDRIVE